MNYRELRSKIINDAAKANIPVLGEFELTSHCNLACKMCYVVDNQSKDLTTEEWKRIFKQAYDSGLIFALLTGGELFVRNDFVELYNYLFDLGVRITLFTNGIFISDQVIDCLTKRPPEYLAITVYGASNETYELVTSVKYGFDQLIVSLEKLRENRINTVLRTIPLLPIYQELDKIIGFAKEFDLKLYHAQYLGPTKKGEFPHQELRLNASDLLDFTKRIEVAFDSSAKETENHSVDWQSCAALKSGYFINYEGLMMPCALAYKPARSVLGENHLLQTFQILSKELIELESNLECTDCKYLYNCIQCYARRLLEGTDKKCAPYLKAYAKKRLESK